MMEYELILILIALCVLHIVFSLIFLVYSLYHE